jgi:ABC-type lipoprotein export system ATPase subunit
MIEVTGVTKAFNTGNTEIRAVDELNLSVKPGEFVLVFGRSGSGKSTVLGMLAGLIRPTSGTIVINGLDLSNLTDDKISELRAKEIGFVFQFSGLIPTLTVIENVLVPTLFCKDPGDSYQRAIELLEKTGLSDRAHAYPRTLSSGEMKRAAIARALMNGPTLLIADEPTGDLDVDTEYDIMELFRQLNEEGKTIVMVTHNPDLIPYGSRIFRMEKGSMIEIPKPRDSCQGNEKAVINPE